MYTRIMSWAPQVSQGHAGKTRWRQIDKAAELKVNNKVRRGSLGKKSSFVTLKGKVQNYSFKVDSTKSK